MKKRLGWKKGLRRIPRQRVSRSDGAQFADPNADLNHEFNHEFDKAYNEGFNAGFSKGFEDGHKLAYANQ